MLQYKIYYNDKLCLEGITPATLADLLVEYDPFQDPEHFYGKAAMNKGELEWFDK